MHVHTFANLFKSICYFRYVLYHALIPKNWFMYIYKKQFVSLYYVFENNTIEDLNQSGI